MIPTYERSPLFAVTEKLFCSRDSTATGVSSCQRVNVVIVSGDSIDVEASIGTRRGNVATELTD